jgi:acyl-CoA synthetase (AMP-forming)/AMP-acid ligase II
MHFNLADLFESVVDRVPDRTALVCGDQRRTYAQLEARANQCAHALVARGVRVGDVVGLYLMNGVEYMEAMIGCYKLRAVPVNVNFRYVEDELRYLLDDADAVAVIHHRSFAPRVATVRVALPKLRFVLSVDDGAAPISRRPGRRTSTRRSPALRRCATSPRARPTISTCSTPAARPACRRA